MNINDLKELKVDEKKPLYVWIDDDGFWRLVKVVDASETLGAITLTLKEN